MLMQKITKIVAKEGLIGLQKLEAQGLIQGYYRDRFQKIGERGKDGFVSFAIAKGIGRNSDPEKVKEMIKWLEDAEYLIDYGYIFVSLLRSIRYENPSALEESKYMKVLHCLRHEPRLRDKFDVNFLLDYRKKFTSHVIEWLERIRDGIVFVTGEKIIKTEFGYSYYEEKDCLCHDNHNKSEIHYNRYWGISYVG